MVVENKTLSENKQLTTDTNQLKQSNWYKEAISHISLAEYNVHWQSASGAYQAVNRRQGLKSCFYADRLVMRPRTQNDHWELQLKLKNITSDNKIHCLPQSNPLVKQNDSAISFTHNNQFSVEYVNDQHGIRQNFIIQQAPATPAKKLAVQLAVNKGWHINQVHDRELHFSKRSGDQLSRKITYNSLKVWDASHKELAAKFVKQSDTQFAIEVEATDAVFPVTIDPLSSTANWLGECDQAGASYGFSVAAAGDVNGDGYGDVIIGASLYDNPEISEGKAFVYYGSATGLSSTPAWTAEGNVALAFFGYSVACAGDVNGDGYSDVIVGSYNYQYGNNLFGKAFLYHGSASGLSATPDWTAVSDEPSPNGGGQFGYSVATAGDVNGDGYSDVVIGAPSYSNLQSGEGKVFVFHGSPTGLSLTDDWEMEGNNDNAAFGSRVAPAGDVNGDGYNDIIVGAPGYTNGEFKEGRAFVYHGSAAGLLTTASWMVESDQAGASFGRAVASAGDVNGDGFSDVVIGSHWYDNPRPDGGRVFVYFGSAAGLSTAAAWTADGDQDNAQLGISVACAGDVNGDGFSDLVIGANLYDNAQANGGRAFVYYGSAAGLPATASWTEGSDQLSANFSGSVASAGDINGDGYSDLLIGASSLDNPETNEGAAFLYHGAPGGLSATANWTGEGSQAGEAFGYHLSSAGDVNSDGYSDIIIGAPFFDNGGTDEGRAFVYYGSVSGLPAAASWSAVGDRSNALFGGQVRSAGDVNGDGYGDVIITAPNFTNGQVNEGAAFLYYGSAAGLSASPAWTMEGNQTGASFGSRAAGAGDVNGDGYSDVMVSAPFFDNDQTDEGMVYLYAGSATGLSATPAWSVEGNQGNSRFGMGLSTAGDVNGDGYSDIVIGAFLFDNGESDEGQVTVYYGASNGLSATPGFTVESDQSNARFGFDVASAGDVNGDGYSDIMVGSYAYDNGQTDEGRVYVYYGSAAGLSAASSWTAENDQGAAWFGFSVASAGDVNGDGYSDIIVGSIHYSNGETNEGAAFVYHGSVSGLPATHAWSTESDQPGSFLGCSVSGAGDVNGDGYSDIILGAQLYDNVGAAFMYLGNTTGSLHNNPCLYNVDLSTPVNITNIPESQFGAGLFVQSPWGRTDGRLVWEVKKQGDPFSNVPITNSTQYSGRQSGFTDLGATGTELKALALKAGRENKVRVRVEYSKANAVTGQVYGPWRYIAAYQQGVHGMGTVPLPARLLYFKGMWVNGQPKLQWATANETATDRFMLERSDDGMQFTPVVTLPARGTATGFGNYDFLDVNTGREKLFYRLKMMDADGRFTYSPVIVLQRTGSGDRWTIGPNPVRQQQNLYLNITSNSEKQVLVECIDVNGKRCSRKTITVQKGQQSVLIENPGMASGAYIIRLTGFSSQPEWRKILVVR